MFLVIMYKVAFCATVFVTNMTNIIKETGENIMTRLKRALSLALAAVMLLGAIAFTPIAKERVAAEAAASLINGSTLVLNLSAGTLTNVVPNTTAGTIKGNFVGGATVYNAVGTAVSDSANVGTGYSVKSGSASLFIIVNGDLNGDGDIASTDKLYLVTAMDRMGSQATYVRNAADVNGDGSCGSADVLMLSLHISGGTDMFSAVYGAKYVLSTATTKYSSAADALAGTNSTGTASAGTYYVYKGYPHGLNGMYNLTTDSTGKTAGFWIDATAVSGSGSSSEEESEDDDESSSVATGTPYVIVTTVNKYANAVNAANRTNPTGTVSAGTYYIYNNYPNGYNGMYCLSSDTTGNTASFWINPAENTVATAEVYELLKDTPKYSSATDALSKTNSTGTAAAGTYYIYKNYPNGYQGMYNLTTDPTGATAGFWINPEEEEEPTAATYQLAVDVPKYANVNDALNKTNSTGTAAAGTYYIYNGYPTGLSGMYCLTNDSTGATPSFWINPSDIAVDFVDANGKVTLVRNINKYSSSTDAVNQTNVAGVIDKGTTYYVYKNYPNGYNGVYNITTDSTGQTAGFWVNPIENTTGKLNYNTVKGIWISQYEMQSMALSGSNQASKTTYTNKVKNALNAAKNSGYNTVMLQVRPNGDSFYPSAYYPLSKYVVGSYGLAASYDPLQIFIEQAQALALSVHAWVNPLRLMSTSEITSVGSTYKIKQWYNSSTYNGKYIVAVDGTYYLNPGYADTRNLIIDGVKEICTNYDIDGIHFDDYFYPTTATSFDADAFAASGQANRGNFRRACINVLVSSTYSAIKAIDNEITFGISPAGNIDNNMYQLYADVKTWVKTPGYIDYIAPQLYWGFEHTQSPFEDVLAEWVSLVGATDTVDLIIGLDLSMAYGTTDSYDGTEWTDHKDVVKRQIVAASLVENFHGVMLFSMRYYYNPQTSAYVGNLSAERANYEPTLKALYTTNQ